MLRQSVHVVGRAERSVVLVAHGLTVVAVDLAGGRVDHPHAVVTAGLGDERGHRRVRLDGVAQVAVTEQSADLRGHVDHDVRLRVFDPALRNVRHAQVAADRVWVGASLAALQVDPDDRVPSVAKLLTQVAPEKALNARYADPHWVRSFSASK
jgi:hypothetical protein